jgi:hypothetical protein
VLCLTASSSWWDVEMAGTRAGTNTINRRIATGVGRPGRKASRRSRRLAQGLCAPRILVPTYTTRGPGGPYVYVLRERCSLLSPASVARAH